MRLHEGVFFKDIFALVKIYSDISNMIIPKPTDKAYLVVITSKELNDCSPNEFSSLYIFIIDGLI